MHLDKSSIQLIQDNLNTLEEVLAAMLDSGSISAANARVLMIEIEDTASIIEEHI
tara:strand:+ start:1067 stop:1231 length:165 start_codon:yes stop_codon:yes gene_type:complete